MKEVEDAHGRVLEAEEKRLTQRCRRRRRGRRELEKLATLG